MNITDVDNNAFLGFTAGAAVYNTGHSHNQIVSAINNQADFYNLLRIELAENLSAICSGPYTKKSSSETWRRICRGYI
ncbi:MAG: hypothetical protein B6D34_02140 [Candidatus Brocadia sp. UTAMX1]|jgi:4-aminobutyrate aminotransferase-like enzyme|nr:MAG: hypothetical protein B6D34_02140 [Candidatus Brocadia sp. UTAMX1]